MSRELFMILLFWCAIGILAVEIIGGEYFFGLTFTPTNTIVLFAVFLGGLLISCVFYLESIFKDYIEVIKTHGK